MIDRLLELIPGVRAYGDRHHRAGEIAGFADGAASGYRLGREDGLSEGFDNGLLTARSDAIERLHREARQRRAEEER